MNVRKQGHYAFNWLTSNFPCIDSLHTFLFGIYFQVVLNPKNIRILSVAASALLLRLILIPFEFVTNRTLFIETITCDFPHLERRIYTYILSVAASALILSVAASALLLRSILIPFEFVTNRTLFIETITCVFPHLERRIYTYTLSVAASALLLWSIFPFEQELRAARIASVAASAHLLRSIFPFEPVLRAARVL